jgi:DnaK suppressor protein
MLVTRKPRSLSFKTESWFYVDVKPYQQRLIDVEASLLSRTTRDVTTRREQSIGTAADAGDASVADESDSEDFTQAELDATILRQVHDAVRRIENGTYGQCLIDGGPIDPKRLDAVPWAPYCIRHQKLLDAASRPHPNALNPNENRPWLPAVPRVRALVRRFAELPRRLSSARRAKRATGPVEAP